MEQSLIIGKLGNQPFQICDPDVSRRHATLYFDKATGAISLEDSNSTNGTYILTANSLPVFFRDAALRFALKQ